MTSGIQSNGVDLDSIFSLYSSGTHPAATGIAINGTDINTRYQPLSSGSPVAATGIEVNGADLNTIFGSGTPVIPSPAYGNLAATVGEPSGTWTASNVVNILSNGTFATQTTGNWYTGAPITGIGSSYFVLFSTTTSAHTNGTLTITNPTSSGRVSLSSTQTLTIALAYTIAGSSTPAATASGTYTVAISNSGGTVLSSAGGNWQLEVQYVP